MAKNYLDDVLHELMAKYLMASNDKEAIEAIAKLRHVYDIYELEFTTKYNDAMKWPHAISRFKALVELGGDKSLSVEQRYSICLNIHDERAHLNFETEFGPEIAKHKFDRDWLPDRLADLRKLDGTD